MAGKRMRLPGYVELSAIATHPAARCRGLCAQRISQRFRSTGAPTSRITVKSGCGGGNRPRMTAS
jgi:hypothetical protein